MSEANVKIITQSGYGLYIIRLDGAPCSFIGPLLPASKAPVDNLVSLPGFITYAYRLHQPAALAGAVPGQIIYMP
jgi:hypothetical protein